MQQNSRASHPSDVARKRLGFMRDIQNIERDNIKRRARSEMISFLTKEDLSELIENTSHSIAPQDLGKLMKYVNQQFPAAIAHMGNLVLDGVVQIPQLERYQLNPGYHPYWLWFIETLVEKEYCTLPLLDFCLKAVSPQRSERTVKSALSVLFKITSSPLNSPILFRGQDSLIAVLNACLRQDSASEVAYLLVNELIIQNQGLQFRLEEGILRKKMIKILINGSLKREARAKFLTCRIMLVLLSKGVYFPQLNQTLMILMKQAPNLNMEEVVLEILTEFIAKAKVEDLMSMVEFGLIMELGDWKQCFEKSGDDENHSRLLMIARQLNQRVTGLGLISKGVHRQLEKYCLLSFSNKLELC